VPAVASGVDPWAQDDRCKRADPWMAADHPWPPDHRV